ncbi:MAG: cytochrome c nitrite reductase small subunit [bacterium]
MKNPIVYSLLAIAVGALIGIGGFTFWYARGYSYLSDDPKACVNCHIMRDNFDSWIVSSHRTVTCNDCHTAHDVFGKYLTKLRNGVHHSVAFTFREVQVPRTTQTSLDIIQKNCLRCHEPMVGMLFQAQELKTMRCTQCHLTGGHVF